MTAYTLHLPDDRGFSRWILAALLILLAHLAIVTSIALWYARRPAESNIVPAIAVTVAPVDASSPERQDQDIAVGPTMQQAEEAPRQLPKERQAEKTEQPPPPQQQADITLPREAPKEIETPKPQVQPPAPRRARRRRPSILGSSPKPAPTPITRWYSDTCNASNAIRRPHMALPAQWSCSSHWTVTARW